MVQHRVCLLVSLMFIVVFAVSSEADDKMPAFSMRCDEFESLSTTDRRLIVKNALENRLHKVLNIEFHAVQLGQTREVSDGRIGKVLQELNGVRYRFRSIEGDYLIEWELGGAKVSEPNELGSSGYDSHSGIVSSTFSQPEKKAFYGRIDSKQNTLKTTLRYVYWLDGTSDPEDMANYLIRDVVRNIDAANIECQSDLGQVHVEIPWNPPWGEPEHLGTRKVVLDPVMGFVPIEGVASWKKPRRDGKVSWRTEEFKVEESIFVDGVWFPSNLKEWIRASSTSDSFASGQVTVWETKVSKMSAGVVATKDLVVQLPVGARVADVLNGAVYTVGENGAHLNEQALIGPEAIVVPKTTQIEGPRFWLFALNAGLLMLAGVLLLRVARRSRIK